MRFLTMALALLIAQICIFADIEVNAASTGLGSQPVWQDSDRNHRRSPPQIINQLTPPQVRAGGNLPLASDAQSERQAKTRNMLSGAAAPLLKPGELPMLEEGDWRLKILPAAITRGENVLLGEIATPLGEIDPTVWDNLKNRELWVAPPQEGKPLQINRSKLSQALRQALGAEYAGRCILPTSLVIQRGGVVFREEDLRSYVVKSLAPQMAAMPGEAELTDFRLPEYIFLAHNQQRVQLEPGKVGAGRIPLKFAVQEADGNVLRRVSGTVNLNLWITAPAAARPINKGETLTPDSITFMRVNANQFKDLPWDGQGGPWQVVRALASGEPILQSDLASKMSIRRGNVITLVYSRGNVRMQIQVEALADGEPGATIPVRNLQTKKQVYATVKDGSTVEIH